MNSSKLRRNFTRWRPALLRLFGALKGRHNLAQGKRALASAALGYPTTNPGSKPTSSVAEHAHQQRLHGAPPRTRRSQTTTCTETVSTYQESIFGAMKRVFSQQTSLTYMEWNEIIYQT